MYTKMEQFAKLIPKEKIDAATPMGEWCQCRTTVRRAAQAFRTSGEGREVNEADWSETERVLAGIIPRCKAAEKMKEEKRHRLEKKAVRLIIEMQDIVVAMKQARGQQIRKVRAEAAAEDRERWQTSLAERAQRGHRRGRLGMWALKIREPRRRQLREEAMKEASELQQQREADAIKDERSKRRRGGEAALTRAATGNATHRDEKPIMAKAFADKEA